MYYTGYPWLRYTFVWGFLYNVKKSNFVVGFFKNNAKKVSIPMFLNKKIKSIIMNEIKNKENFVSKIKNSF